MTTASDLLGHHLVFLGARTLIGRLAPTVGSYAMLLDALELTVTPVIRSVGGQPVQQLVRGLRTICLFDELDAVALPDTFAHAPCSNLNEEHRKELANMIDAIEQEKRAQASGLVLAGRPS